MSTHIPYVDFAVWIKFCVDLGETNCFRFCILGFLRLQWQLYQIIADISITIIHRYRNLIQLEGHTFVYQGMVQNNNWAGCMSISQVLYIKHSKAACVNARHV